ncbi:MAG: ComEC/Rec2 family competence protein, partial [bacterium]
MRETVMGDTAGTDLPKFRPARPMVRVAIGYMAGLVVGWSFPANVALLSSLLILVLGVILLLALRRTPGVHQTIWICSILAALLVGAIRAELISAHQRSIDHQISDLASFNPVTLSGRILAPPSISGDSVRVLLGDAAALHEQTTYPIPGSVELRFRSDHLPDLPLGSRVQANADITELQGAMLPGGFSPRDFYYARSQVARAYTDEESVIITPPTEPKSVWEWFNHAVWSFGNEGFRVVRERFPSPEAGLLAALAFGVRTDLTWEVENAFGRSGLAHITVVSGLHLTLLLSGLLWLLKSIGLRRRMAFILAVPLIGFFLLLVGPR